MIELLWTALSASLVGLITPLGLGWLWNAALARAGSMAPSLGMTYWMGLISLGALILLGYGFGLPQAVVVWLVAAALTGGWLWKLGQGGRGETYGLRTAWPLLPLAVAGTAYCVLDPVRVWDSYLVWFARVRLLDEWIPLSRFHELQIVHPGYPFLGAGAWWWTEWAARVPAEAGRVVFLFAYLAFFLAVLSRSDARESIRFRLLWVFLAYSSFLLEIINGYQDGFLMVSTGMVALAFLQWDDRGATWIAPLAAGLSLIKAEGAIVGLILVFSWFVSQPSRLSASFRHRFDRRAVVVGGLAFACVVAAWPCLQMYRGLDWANVQGNAFRIHSIGVLFAQADRIPKVLWSIARHYGENPWVTVPFSAALLFSLVGGTSLERGRRFILVKRTGFLGDWIC